MGWIDLFKKKNVEQNTALSENKITESRDMAVGNHTGIIESKSKHIVPGISSTQTDSAKGQFRRENGEFQWNITSDGCLMIYGNGALTQDVEYEVNSGDGWDGHYSTTETSWPWKNFVPQIKKIFIGEGITEIGHHAFCEYSNVNVIELPNTLLEIGYSAFSETGISQIHIPDTVKHIGVYAFLKTGLPHDEDEFYVDGWLITYTGKGTKRYYVRPGTRGIAESAFDWCDIEEYVMNGKVYRKR